MDFSILAELKYCNYKVVSRGLYELYSGYFKDKIERPFVLLP